MAHFSSRVEDAGGSVGMVPTVVASIQHVPKALQLLFGTTVSAGRHSQQPSQLQDPDPMVKLRESAKLGALQAWVPRHELSPMFTVAPPWLAK